MESFVVVGCFFFCSIVYCWIRNLLVSPLQSDALCHAVQQRYRGEFIAFDCRLLQLAVWFTSVSLQGWRVRVFLRHSNMYSSFCRVL